MRCNACNKVLNNYESSMKTETSEEFVDLCLDCSKSVDLNVMGNLNYLHESDTQYPDELDSKNTADIFYGIENIIIDDH